VSDCVFYDIVKGKVPASIVYADDKVMAFMDTRPVNPGHALIIPKAHASQLSELDEETGGHMFKIAMRIDEALRRSGLRCEGVTLLLADGEAAFQEIFHVHLHVIPRFRGDSFGIRFGRDYGREPNRKELATVAGKIKVALS
jgi:histidine triad (HIT) family protein